MRKTPQAPRANQQFYLKNLHTESFSSPSLKDEFIKLSDKMENEIQAVKKRMRVKNLKMFRAKEKLKTIENQQEKMRETLRHQIENKLKISQSKLENMIITKNSQSNSKEKLRQTTLLRIKSMQKTWKQESFRKSQQLSKDSESFLLQRKLSQSRSKISSFGQTQSRTRYIQDDSRRNQSVPVIQTRKKILPAVLKVTDKQLRQRQSRKSKIQESKQFKNLQDYVQKLNHIDAKRQNRSDRLADTVKLIEKGRKQQEQRYANRKKAQSLGEDRVNKSYTSATRQAIKSKYSFSELYTKKLQQKMAKKAYFQSQILKQGDAVMRREGQMRLRKRQSRLVSQAVKQVQRKVNFRYMQRFRS